jgi:hypothetical protein
VKPGGALRHGSSEVANGRASVLVASRTGGNRRVLLLWVATGQEEEEEEEEESWRCGAIAGWRDPDGEARAAGRTLEFDSKSARGAAHEAGAERSFGMAGPRGRTNERTRATRGDPGLSVRGRARRGRKERKPTNLEGEGEEGGRTGRGGGSREGAAAAARWRRRRGSREEEPPPGRGRWGGVGPVGVRSEPSLTRAPGLGRLRSESNNRLMDGWMQTRPSGSMDRVGRNWPPKGVIL